MVGAGGADANADTDATSSRFGAKEEDANATPSGKASNLPRRTAASLSRDGDDKLDCHRTAAWDGFGWAGKQAGKRGRQPRGCQPARKEACEWLLEVGWMAAGVRRGQGGQGDQSDKGSKGDESPAFGKTSLTSEVKLETGGARLCWMCSICGLAGRVVGCISTPPDQDRSSFSAAHILSEPMSPCHICRVARPYIVYSRRRGLFVSLVLDAQQFQEKQGVGQNRQLGGYDSR
ncbi:hypothetical protein F4824DRAFT_496656 [Ustulina deusta]|nr:hypothetical protein F4824DRAFT_496656 [Ustulina deusta]